MLMLNELIIRRGTLGHPGTSGPPHVITMGPDWLLLCVKSSASLIKRPKNTQTISGALVLCGVTVSGCMSNVFTSLSLFGLYIELYWHVYEDA